MKLQAYSKTLTFHDDALQLTNLKLAKESLNQQEKIVRQSKSKCLFPIHTMAIVQ